MKGLEIKTDDMAKIVDSINSLIKKSVLVGIPATEAGRNDDDSPMDNATLGYLHETGSPAANIPARPFLIPGVLEAQDKFEPQLEKAANAALGGFKKKIDDHLNAAGIIASQSAKNMLENGDHAPLAIATLRARARKGRKGAAEELASRAAGNAPNAANARPLIDTGQMRNSLTYILREG
jgi:hypothetical protein